MEYLNQAISFGIFLDNYFPSFRLLTHLGVNNIWAEIDCANALSFEDLKKQLQKMERGDFEQRTSSKKAV